MKVKVRFFAALREITCKKEEEIETIKEGTVEDLLKKLSKKHSYQFSNYVYGKNGKIRSNLQFLVNGKSTKTLNDLKTKLEEGDEFAIIPPVGGG